MEKISDRLVRLYSPELAGTARAILASLGKIDRPYLIPLDRSFSLDNIATSTSTS